jgi:hypothetical protein
MIVGGYRACVWEAAGESCQINCCRNAAGLCLWREPRFLAQDWRWLGVAGSKHRGRRMGAGVDR